VTFVNIETAAFTGSSACADDDGDWTGRSPHDKLFRSAVAIFAMHHMMVIIQQGGGKAAVH
jgi:hypothetical protein